jgi:hypothetical protein
MEKQSFHVSDEIQEKRFNICKSCPDLLSDLTCSHCKCPMETKTTLDWFGCPIGKWPAEVVNV